MRERVLRNYQNRRNEFVDLTDNMQNRTFRILQGLVEQSSGDDDDSSNLGRAGHLPSAWGDICDWAMSMSNKVDKMFMLQHIRRYSEMCVGKKARLDQRFEKTARRLAEEEELVQEIWASLQLSENANRIDVDN